MQFFMSPSEEQAKQTNILMHFQQMNERTDKRSKEQLEETYNGFVVEYEKWYIII